jgi:hypothetical protein
MQSLWTRRKGQSQLHRRIHRLSNVEVHLVLRLMCPLTCEENVIQQVRQQPPWNVWSDLELPATDLELPATVMCLTYNCCWDSLRMTSLQCIGGLFLKLYFLLLLEAINAVRKRLLRLAVLVVR